MHKFYMSLSENYICALSLVLVILFSVVSPEASAQEISVRARLQVAQSVIGAQVDKAISENSRFSNNMTGLKYDDEVPIQIDEMRYDLILSESKSQYFSESQTLVTNLPEIKVYGSIPRIHIFGVITKVINGAQFNIKIDSECKNISYELVFEKNLVHTKFTNLKTESQFLFGSHRLKVNPFSCTAVQGMDAFLAQKVNQILENKIALQQVISTKLESILKQQASSSYQNSLTAINDLLNKIDPDLSISGTQFNFSQNETTIDLILKTRKTINYIPTKSILKSVAGANSKAAFLISKSDFDFLIQNALAKKMKSSMYWSDDIPEFKKLLNSRFKQFFIWPALMSRSKGKPLILQPMIEGFSTELPTEQIQHTLGFKMQVGQWALDDSKPMVYFRSQASFSSELTGAALVQGLDNSYIWDQSYLAAHNVSQRISLGLVNSAARTFIQEKLNMAILSSQSSFLKRIKYLYLSKDQILELGLE